MPLTEADLTSGLLPARICSRGFCLCSLPLGPSLQNRARSVLRDRLLLRKSSLIKESSAGVALFVVNRSDRFIIPRFWGYRRYYITFGIHKILGGRFGGFWLTKLLSRVLTGLPVSCDRPYSAATVAIFSDASASAFAGPIEITEATLVFLGSAAATLARFSSNFTLPVPERVPRCGSPKSASTCTAFHSSLSVAFGLAVLLSLLSGLKVRHFHLQIFAGDFGQRFRLLRPRGRLLPDQGA